VVASGVDACASDPTARMLLVSDSYRVMSARMLELAGELCGGRLAMSHEGGYEPTATPFCALAIIEAMSEIRTGVPDASGEAREDADHQRLQQHQEAVIEQAEALLSHIR